MLDTLKSLYESYMEHPDTDILVLMHKVCKDSCPVMARILTCAIKGYASTPRHLLLREIGKRLESGVLA